MHFELFHLHQIQDAEEAARKKAERDAKKAAKAAEKAAKEAAKEAAKVRFILYTSIILPSSSSIITQINPNYFSSLHRSLKLPASSLSSPNPTLMTP